MKYTFADDLTYNKTKKEAILHQVFIKSPSFDLFCKMAKKGLLEKIFPLAQKGYIFGEGGGYISGVSLYR